MSQAVPGSPAVGPLGGRYRFSDSSPELEAELRAGRTTWRDDAAADPALADAEKAAFAARRIGAWANASLVNHGRLVAMLSAHFPDAHDGRARPGRAEREKARETLAAQTRFLEATLSSIPDVVYAFDREHRFVYVNRSMQKLSGLSAEQTDRSRSWSVSPGT